MNRYLFWSLAVLGVCATLVAAAWYFGKPAVLLGLGGILWLPSPYEEGN